MKNKSILPYNNNQTPTPQNIVQSHQDNNEGYFFDEDEEYNQNNQLNQNSNAQNDQQKVPRIDQQVTNKSAKVTMVNRKIRKLSTVDTRISI